MKDVLESDRCAQLLRALADPERLKIVQCLRGGSRNVGEIAEALHVEMANVSHHLSILRRSRFVLAEKQGRFVAYSLNPEFFVAKADGKTPSRIDLRCCCIELPLA